MSLQQLIGSNFEFTFGLLEGAIDGLSSEQLHHTHTETEIASIASIYAHILLSTDSILHGMLQGQPSLYVAAGWDAKIGIPYTPGLGDRAWHDAARISDIDQFRAYAKSVYTAIAEYVASVSDAELERTLETPMGTQTVAWCLNNFMAWHTIQHLGEICALKGMLGAKGLPF